MELKLTEVQEIMNKLEMIERTLKYLETRTNSINERTKWHTIQIKQLEKKLK